MAQDGKAEGANVSGGQGVQAGSGNTQINNWMAEPQLDAASLGALNPHVALGRLRGIPHDELVNLFARASSDDLADILETWLETDKAKIVAVLADLRRARAEELIRPLARQAPWLARLPEAGYAINRSAAKLGWNATDSLKPVFTRVIVVSVDRGGTRVVDRFDGYSRRYDTGSFFWREGGAMVFVGGSIGALLAKHDFGFPVSAQRSAPGLADKSRIFQKFTHGIIYSSEQGVYPVFEIALECHERTGGIVGWLGFPVTSMTPFGAPGEPGPLYIQRFEGGAIFLLPSGDVVAARQMTLDFVGKEWSPISDEVPVSSSPLPPERALQEFEHISGTRKTIHFSGARKTIHWSSNCCHETNGSIVIALPVTDVSGLGIRIEIRDSDDL